MSDTPETATGARAPLAVWAIVIAIVGAYAAYSLTPLATQQLLEFWFALIPERFNPASELHFTHWYEPLGAIFGHAFMHVAWWHAGLNAFFLFAAGRLPAERLGSVRFLLVYFASVLGGALAFVAFNLQSVEIAVGASGGVCGIFSAYFLALRPTWRQAIADRAIRGQWTVLFVINVVVMGVASELGWFPVAWEAHMGGFIGGALGYIALAPKPVIGPWTRSV